MVRLHQTYMISYSLQQANIRTYLRTTPAVALPRLAQKEEACNSRYATSRIARMMLHPFEQAGPLLHK